MNRRKERGSEVEEQAVPVSYHVVELLNYVSASNRVNG